jgi:hypothetical protein
MKMFNQVLADELSEILNLKADIYLQENNYVSLLNEDKPFEVLKEVRLNIRYLKDKLIVTEKNALTLLEL